MTLTGTITLDGFFVITEEGAKFSLPVRGMDKDDKYPEVLMDTKAVGGTGEFYRKSVKPYLGMKVEFETATGKDGYNFKLIK